MFRSAIRALTLVAAVSANSPTTARQAQPSTGIQEVGERFVAIDGQKNPELIPEWLAWREAFRTLATVDIATSGFTRNLSLSKLEVDTLVKEARQEKSREEVCLKRQEQTHEQAAKASPEALKAALDDDRIDCRWLTLDARDRVLEALSPDSRVSLEAFLIETRAGIKSIVPKDELNTFRRPQ